MKKTKIFIFTLLTLISLFMDVRNIINNIKNPFISGSFEFLLIGVLIYKMYYNYYNKKEKNIIFIIISILFSLFMLIGDTFSKTNSFKLMFNNDGSKTNEEVFYEHFKSINKEKTDSLLKRIENSYNK